MRPSIKKTLNNVWERLVNGEEKLGEEEEEVKEELREEVREELGEGSTRKEGGHPQTPLTPPPTQEHYEVSWQCSNILHSFIL